MFLRKKKNNSESVSIQISSKSRGKYKVVKTIDLYFEASDEDDLRKTGFSKDGIYGVQKT